jgi:hypothetical protein
MKEYTIIANANSDDVKLKIIEVCFRKLDELIDRFNLSFSISQQQFRQFEDKINDIRYWTITTDEEGAYLLPPLKENEIVEIYFCSHTNRYTLEASFQSNFKSVSHGCSVKILNPILEFLQGFEQTNQIDKVE